jgi:hypothetical protein
MVQQDKLQTQFQEIKAQWPEIESLRGQLQSQNAAVPERPSRLEKLVWVQAQIVAR